MPRDGSGNYSLPSGNPVVTNTVISSTTQNSTMSDVASALTQSLSRDGQTTPTANMTMGNFRLTNLANAQARTDAVNAGQIQDNQLVVLSSIGGTGDAITASTAPAITVYTTDAKWVYTPTNANTLTNPTININGLGAKTITQSNGSGLWSGALVVGTPYELLYDGTNFRIQTGQLGNLIPATNFPFCLRNKTIDGNFDIWDGGSSFSSGTYGSTLFTFSAGTGGSPAATVSQGTFAAGAEPAGMTQPVRFYWSHAQTASASVSNPGIVDHIENVSSFEGRSATLSCWLWTASGTQTITSVTAAQVFGAGGSSTVNTTVSVNWALTTTPQRFSVRLDLPSISGKTIGTGDYVGIQVNFPLSATYTINVSQWQVEDCPASAPATGLPTPFENIGVQLNRMRLQRFVLYPNVASNISSYADTSGRGIQALTYIYPQAMRSSTPAVTIANGGGINVNIGTLSASATALTQSATGAAAGYVYYNYTLSKIDARW